MKISITQTDKATAAPFNVSVQFDNGPDHPATALYQICEIVQQLTHRAGPNQIKNAQIGLLQSVGGAVVTVLTHILGHS